MGTATATGSTGPRFFHFVIGGATPAALAADGTVSLLDQNAAVRASSMFAHELETVADVLLPATVTVGAAAVVVGHWLALATDVPDGDSK